MANSGDWLQSEGKEAAGAGLLTTVGSVVRQASKIAAGAGLLTAAGSAVQEGTAGATGSTNAVCTHVNIAGFTLPGEIGVFAEDKLSDGSYKDYSMSTYVEDSQAYLQAGGSRYIIQWYGHQNLVLAGNSHYNTYSFWHTSNKWFKGPNVFKSNDNIRWVSALDWQHISGTNYRLLCGTANSF